LSGLSPRIIQSSKDLAVSLMVHTAKYAGVNIDNNTKYVESPGI